MKRSLLCMTAALLLCGAAFAQTNHWGNDPDSHAQPSNTPIVASVTVDDEAVTVTDDMRLGAFVGDELRGIAAPHTDGKFWIQVFYTDATDNITFKFYDGTDEYATCATTLAGSDEGYGTPSTPETLNFTSTQTMTQTTELAEGWTWWSTPIEMEDNNGLQQLESCLGSNGIMIKSKESYVQYMTFMNQWVGSIPITNEESYKIDVHNTCDLSISGIIASPEDHPITISNNWNWIGYPVNQTQTITNALGDFQPSVNDILKDQGAYAQYFPGIGWQPATFSLSPGKGYLYYSNSSQDKTLVFSNSGTRYITENENIENHWKANVHGYADNMCLMATIIIDGEEQKTNELELGAFVNGECRGSGKAFYIESIDRYYVMMTISGEVGDAITFRCIDTNDSFGFNTSDDKLFFVDNGIIGHYDNPFPIHFSSSNGFVQSEGRIEIFPNPVDCNESFSLVIPEDEVITNLIYVDIKGNIVRNDIGLSSMSATSISVPGLYNITIICKSGNIYHGRIIVK